MYKVLFNLTKKYIKEATLLKYGFNLSPMYRRSTGKVVAISDDLMEVFVKIPRSYKNKNYVGSIFGGSLFAATDPIYMIQLMNILGDDYVVWDKATEIKFRRPAYSDAYAKFEFTKEEVAAIKEQVLEKNELDWIKDLAITNKEGKAFCELKKTIYIADKAYYKRKRKAKK